MFILVAHLRNAMARTSGIQLPQQETFLRFIIILLNFFLIISLFLFQITPPLALLIVTILSILGCPGNVFVRKSSKKRSCIFVTSSLLTCLTWIFLQAFSIYVQLRHCPHIVLDSYPPPPPLKEIWDIVVVIGLHKFYNLWLTIL